MFLLQPEMYCTHTHTDNTQSFTKIILSREYSYSHKSHTYRCLSNWVVWMCVLPCSNCLSHSEEGFECYVWRDDIYSCFRYFSKFYNWTIHFAVELFSVRFLFVFCFLSIFVKRLDLFLIKEYKHCIECYSVRCVCVCLYMCSALI